MPTETEAIHETIIAYWNIFRRASRLYQEGGYSFTEGLNLFDRHLSAILKVLWYLASDSGEDKEYATLFCDWLCEDRDLIALRLVPSIRKTWVESALELSKKYHLDSHQAKLLGILGMCYTDLGKEPRARECYNEQLILARKGGYKESESAALTNIGMSYLDSNIRIAIQYLEDALIINREIGNLKDIGIDISLLGNTWWFLGDLEKARQLITEAYEIDAQIGDKQGICYDMGDFSRICLSYGDYRKAQAYAYKSFDLAIENKDNRGKDVGYNALGNVLVARQCPDMAISLFEEALKIDHEDSDDLAVAMTLINLGKAYIASEKYSQAIDCLNEALPIIREMEDEQLESEVNCYLGEIFILEDRIPEAVERLRESFRLSKRAGDNITNILTSWHLGTAYAIMGDYAKATKFMKKRVAFEMRYNHPDAANHSELLKNLVKTDKEIEPNY